MSSVRFSIDQSQRSSLKAAATAIWCLCVNICRGLRGIDNNNFGFYCIPYFAKNTVCCRDVYRSFLLVNNTLTDLLSNDEVFPFSPGRACYCVTGGAVPLLAVLANVACFCKINVQKILRALYGKHACSSARVSAA